MTTLSQAKALLSEIGMTLRKTDGEYRVAHKEHGNDSEPAAYYTNDIDDAVDTGRAMRRRANEQKAPRVTLAKINDAIREAGGSEELVRGAGYFYFIGGDSVLWYSSSVYVYRLADLSLEAWLKEWLEKRNDARNH